jgi:hypothetical protein
MMRTVVALAFLTLLSNASAAFAAPSLWVIKSPSATVYLFGTIHLLRASQDWETQAIKDALADSQELWLEVPDLDDAASARKLVAQLGYDSAHPLSTVLPAKDLARLKMAAGRLGLPEGEATFEPMRPWLAALALTESQILHAGYQPNAGVEHILLDQWKPSLNLMKGLRSSMPLSLRGHEVIKKHSRGSSWTNFVNRFLSSTGLSSSRGTSAGQRQSTQCWSRRQIGLLQSVPGIWRDLTACKSSFQPKGFASTSSASASLL